MRVQVRMREGAGRVRPLRSGQSRGCGCARPAPLSGKTEKTVAQSDPVGDEWMFGKMGSRGLFARRR